MVGGAYNTLIVNGQPQEYAMKYERDLIFNFSLDIYTHAVDKVIV